MDEVAVLMMIEPFTVFDPIIFPSPACVPPTLIPGPFDSIPVKAMELGDFGMEDTVMPAIVFPFTWETGEALVLVNKMPW